MNDNNPFKLIAKNFPYKSPVALCDEDRPMLVQALLENISERVTESSVDNYGAVAARHVVYLEMDYGLPYAAAYFESLRKIPKIHLNETFFKHTKIQDIIKKIYMNDDDHVQTEANSEFLN